MKRKLAVFTLLLVMSVSSFGISSTQSASADSNIFDGICKGQNDTSTNASNTDVCKDQSAADADASNPVIRAIRVTVTILAVIIGVASVVVIILSGFRLMQSGGDSQKVAAARSAIIYALVGIVIAMLAGVIVSLVLSKL